MDRSRSTEVASIHVVEEVQRGAGIPLLAHPEWESRFPWLVQATTGRGDGGDPFDLGSFGAAPIGKVMQRWRLLREATGMPTIVHSRQVHGAEIASWTQPLPPGLVHVEGFDAHVTGLTGLLLSVSVADCVPVFLVHEEPRAIGLVHAGWRGAAAGIVERAIELLVADHGASAEGLWLHCGPSICARCYEVGPEVHSAVRRAVDPPEGPEPIDLRGAIAERVIEVGLGADRISISAHCTRCGPGAFFSHRGGSPERQMGLLGLRA